MPKPKRNVNYDTRENVWHRDLVEEFIKNNPIPESWGPNITFRHHHVERCVTAAIDPKKIKGGDLNVEDGNGYTFFQLFSKEPDYFLALLNFTRDKVSSFHQIKKVATLLIDQCDQLPRSHDGKLASDYEIAIFCASQPSLGLKVLHPSVVGKARNYLAQQDAARREAAYTLLKAQGAELKQMAINAYPEEKETPAFKRWFKRKRKKGPVTFDVFWEYCMTELIQMEKLNRQFLGKGSATTAPKQKNKPSH